MSKENVPKEIDLTKLTDKELLSIIYWDRGYVSEKMFYEIEQRIMPLPAEHSRYQPSSERDPDVLYQEIQRLRRSINSLQTMCTKMGKEIKELRK